MLRRPPPPPNPVHLAAKVNDASDDRATMVATHASDGVVCATCRGLFVAVKEGHPAYHRW
jgi:hypothetical protein